MACYGCTKKFGVLTKEIACASCGFGFCSKCLKPKAIVPGKGYRERHVCESCHLKLTKNVTDNILPPDAFIKDVKYKENNPGEDDFHVQSPDLLMYFLLRRLENLSNPSAPPITVYRTDQKIAKLKIGLSPEDQKIADRLERLRDDSINSPPSEDEIRIRLAKLKDENFNGEQQKKKQVTLTTPDLRTDAQKVDDLLEQYVKETQIETPTNSSDEEGSTERIIEKIMEEVKIDKACSIAGIDIGVKTPSTTKYPRHPRFLKSEDRGTPLHASTPELSFCVICYGTAAKRCLDCDGDLYCSSCFTEIHRDWSETHHRSIEFKPDLLESDEDL